MKLQLDQMLKDPKGEPFTDKSRLRDALYGALNATLPADNQLPLPEQMKRYRLIQRVVNADSTELDVTAEEIALIKERCSKLYPISIVGAVVDLLEELSAPRLVEKAAPPAEAQS